MKSIWRTLTQLFPLLPKGATPFYIGYSILTSMLAILDTVALALIAMIVTPMVSGQPITLPFVGELPASATVWIVVIVCGLFVLKGVLAVMLHWVATRRFARYELEVGDRLFRSYTHSSWEERSQLSTAEITRIVDSSMANTNLGFILPLSQIPGNALTFVSVLAVLVVAQPLSALIALVYLGLISGVMLLVVTRKSQLAGRHNREYAYRVATIMTEMVEALKEVTLRGKLDEIGKVVTENRKIATRARANISFLSIVPKYAFEAALIGGFLLIGGAAYLTGGQAAAVVAVSLFAATGFRMIPAMNAVQTSFTQASANEVFAKDIIRELGRVERTPEHAEVAAPERPLPERPKSLALADVSFRYPGSEQNVLSNISIDVPFGSSLAVVGPSGAGKSTLIDLILGLSTPSSGTISIDGEPIQSFLTEWRHRVGYVPQRVALFDASIAQNVALTWGDDYDEERVAWALERAQLSELLDRPGGLQEKIGERGVAISGGQQQRLGIARALYSDPLVLVLDEATSALDTRTENRVTEAMKSLQGEVTFITIAHRLATIRDYDRLCYLDAGRILGSGRFEEVVADVPDFAIQASLAGLIGDEPPAGR
ncbi:ABC transporter ATP-binding protein [Leucobacter sp. CSA2]|uniref:ABC transporter ATP-binding protein n=1 Tax=Leucobacter edaphi TaxID=2796472 RepID=A0A934QE47_9MICO|nr:ABC transporter ATP-binding protein [Leucobacter edaphi]MBK0421629.1 ABC transporter ATP-binding protein [Leucobacter edaphi]